MLTDARIEVVPTEGAGREAALLCAVVCEALAHAAARVEREGPGERVHSRLQCYAAERLRSAGYVCQFEVKRSFRDVGVPGTVRRGVLDLLVRAPGSVARVAVEIDRANKTWSWRKLVAFLRESPANAVVWQRFAGSCIRSPELASDLASRLVVLDALFLDEVHRGGRPRRRRRGRIRPKAAR
jgi:hypothetical protein